MFRTLKQTKQHITQELTNFLVLLLKPLAPYFAWFNRIFEPIWLKWVFTAGPILDQAGSYIPWIATLWFYCIFLVAGIGVGVLITLYGETVAGFLGAFVYGGLYFGSMVFYLGTRISFNQNREFYNKLTKPDGFLNVESMSSNVQSYADYIAEKEQRKAEKEQAKTQKV